MSTALLPPRAGPTIRHRRVVDYPDGDGKPMAETDPHVSLIIKICVTLRYWLRDALAYIGANMFLFYKEGFPKQRVAPDVFVAWDVSKQKRRSYKLWEEKQAPQVIFEMTSRKTQDEDLGTKRAIYARLGVAEYYLFDPYGHYLRPPLRGYQLMGEEYALRPVENLPLPNFEGKENPSSSEGWRITSERLKLEIWALPTGASDMPYNLRLYDPVARKWLPDPEQAMIELESFKKQAREAEVRAERETEARKAAEEQVVHLEAELEKLRSKK